MCNLFCTLTIQSKMILYLHRVTLIDCTGNLSITGKLSISINVVLETASTKPNWPTLYLHNSFVTHSKICKICSAEKSSLLSVSFVRGFAVPTNASTKHRLLVKLSDTITNIITVATPIWPLRSEFRRQKVSVCCSPHDRCSGP